MSVKILFSILFYLFFHTILISQISATPMLPQIVMKVADTVVSTKDPSGLLTVYLDNYDSEIFGFQFVLKSSRPDLVKFDFSGLGYDTAGTLISGFEYIEVIDKAGDQSEYWFRCIASFFGGSGSVSPVLPQQGGVAIRVPYTATNAPGTNLSLLSNITFELPTDFADPYGNSIGAVPDTIVDTSYFNCLLWEGPTCTSWVEVTDTSLGYEMVFYDSSTVGLLDPEIVLVLDGSLTIDYTKPFEFIDCDSNGDNAIDISDLVCFVSFLFTPRDPFACTIFSCDTDSSGDTDISDLVAFVDFIFGLNSTQ